MKKLIKLLLISIVLIATIFGINYGLRMQSVQTYISAEQSNIRAYNHYPDNILENIFEKDKMTILPFIFSNSDQMILASSLKNQFEEYGLTIESISTIHIGTGTEIVTTTGTYMVLVYGDVDGDGVVDVFDAQRIVRHYVFGGEYKLTGIYKMAANVQNEDEEIDIFDAERIVKFYVGIESRLVVNEPMSFIDIERERPIITLLGDNPLTIKLGEEYTEPSATVTDNVDTNIKVEIDASAVNVNELGTYYVTYNAINSRGLSAIEKTREVIVIDYITGIEITLPDEITCEYGQDLDLTGATVRNVMASGAKGEEIPITAEMCSGYDKNIIGPQTITVAYNEKTATFVVTVEPPAGDFVIGIEIVTLPEKTTYYYGEDLDLAGATYKKIMNSGIETVTLDITSDMISGYNSEVLGEQTVTITYKDADGSYEDTFTVSVLDYVSGIEVAGFKTEYKYGQALDLTSAIVRKVMASGAKGEDNPITLDMVTGYEPETLGEQTLTVTYEELEKEIIVTVDNYITGIEIVDIPEMLDYIEGETIELAGMVVKAIQANNQKVDIDLADITLDIEVASFGDTIITVRYITSDTIDDNEETFTDTFNITIVKKLTTLVVTEETGTRYVTEEMVLASIKEGENQKPVQIGQIKYHVTLNGEVVSDESIVIESKLRKDIDSNAIEVNENDIMVVATASEIGTYVITAYVGESLAEATATGTSITINVTNNPEVGTITLEEIEDKELRSDKVIEKEISFKNIYGADIELEANRLNIETETGVTVIMLDENDLEITIPDGIVTKVRISTTIEEETNTTITFKVDQAELPVDILIGSKAVWRISMPSSIKLLPEVPSEANELIKPEGDLIYILLPFELINDYSETIGVKGTQFVGTSVAEDAELSCILSNETETQKISVKAYNKNGDEIEEVENTSSASIEYIGIAADPEYIFELVGKKITVTYGKTEPITKTIYIEVELYELKTLIVTEESGDRYASEEMMLAKIREGLNQRPLVSEELKYHVTLDGEEVSDESIVIETKLRKEIDPGTTAATENDIVIVATASKTGTYVITPYVGEGLAEATVKGTSITINVTNNPEVGAIILEEIEDKELRADKLIEKEIGFKNIYGVDTEVEASRLTIETVDGVTVTLLDEDGLVIISESQIVTSVRISTEIEEETLTTITFKVDEASLSVDVLIGEKAKLEISMPDIIKLLPKMPDEPNNLVISEGGLIYVLVPFELGNNYGEEIEVIGRQFAGTNEPQDEELACVDSLYNPIENPFDLPYIKVKIYAEETPGDIEEIFEIGNTSSKAIKYIGIAPIPNSIFKLKGETITVTYGKTEPVTKEIKIDVEWKDLATLTVTEELGNRYASEEMILAKVKEGLNERPLVPEDIKYNVTLEGEAVSGESIVVETKLRKTVDPTATLANGDDIMIVATASKTGIYVITPYVGESLNTAIVTGMAVTINVSDNQEVVEIILEEIEANELRADQSIDKTIEFRNAHGVEVKVLASQLNFETEAGVTVILIDEYGLEANSPSAVVGKVRISTVIETEELTTITFKVDEAELVKDILIAEKARLIINVPNKITLLSSLPDGNTNKLIRKEDDGRVYTLIPFALKTNYGDVITVTGNQFVGTNIAGNGQLSCVDTLYNPIENPWDLPYIQVKIYAEDDPEAIEEILEIGDTSSGVIKYIGIAAIDTRDIPALIAKTIKITFGNATCEPVEMDIVD